MWWVCSIPVAAVVLFGAQAQQPTRSIISELQQLAKECLRTYVGPLPVELRWTGGSLQYHGLEGKVGELRCVCDSALLRQGRLVVERWIHGQWGGRFVVPVQVYVRAPELRLRRAVQAGELIGQEDVEAVERWMTLQEYWQRLRPEQIVGLRLRHTLSAGRPLLREDCLPQLGVRRGERVTLVARVGAVEVRTAAYALEDGEPGHWIRVRREGAGRILTARVVAPTVVEVAPTGLQSR
ncbi:MAG: flagellar basal body P-ring formation chaperone FlgA [Chlorobiota bacterium]